MRWLLGLLLVPGVLFAQGAWRDPFVVYQEAQTAAARKDFQAAKRALDELAAQQLAPPGFYLLYGIVLFGSDELAAARVAFGRALLENPNDATALFYTGLLHLQQNKPNEAREALQRAQALLPAEHELRPSVEKLLQGLDEAAPPPTTLHALRAVSPQADSNAKLATEEAASEAAGARVLAQAAASFAQPLSKQLSLEASGGGLLSVPFINAEALRALDPSVAFTSLSFEARNTKQNLLGGISVSGKLYGLETFRQLFMQEGSALLVAQLGTQRSLRAAYRATLSNFVLSEAAEGTTFDQDSLQQEGSLSLRSGFGALASFLYTQAEADGNSFDRRSFALQVGLDTTLRRAELRASLDGGVVLFPNGEAPRQDLRASFAAQAVGLVRGVGVSLSYQGTWNDSSDENFSYVRHLLTLGTRWQR